MPRRVTEEEAMNVWVKFGCAALTGMMADAWGENMSKSEIMDNVYEFADLAVEQWKISMEGSLEADEEIAAEIESELEAKLERMRQESIDARKDLKKPKSGCDEGDDFG